MSIFKVLGLGLAIIMLKFLTPQFFAGLENTFLAFFDTLQFLLGQSGQASSLFALPPR